MKIKNTLSRRDVTKQIGMAASLTLLGGQSANATPPTPKQGEGPFHPIQEQDDTDANLTLIKGHSETAVGDTILVRGQVLDTDGNPLHNAVIDIWQTNHYGRYAHPKDKNTAPLDPNFQGWAIMTTGHDGRYGFRTIMPGPYPLFFMGSDRWRCRHIHFKISSSGFKDLTTQMYFHGDPWIAHDRLVERTPEAQRNLLIAKSNIDENTGLPLYKFDLVLAKADT